jgi:hypothetical protein
LGFGQAGFDDRADAQELAQRPGLERAAARCVRRVGIGNLGDVAGFAVLTVFGVLTGSAIYSNSSNIGLVDGGIERSAKMGFTMFEFAHAIAI